MNQREKILAILLLSAVGLWGASSFFSKILLAPIHSRTAEIKSLKSRISGQEDKLDQILAAQKRLSAWNSRSLPPDGLDASTLYKNWLLEQATSADFKDINLDRIPPTPVKGIYSTVGVNLKAKGTLKQVADFFHAIQSADLAQKIRKVSLQTDEHQGDPTLDISILIEALAIHDIEPRETLFAAGQEKSVSPQMEGKTREMYAAALSDNPFVRGYNGPPPPKVEEKPAEPKPEKPGIDVAEHVYLVISVSKNDRWDAVLYNRTTNQPTTLRAGEDFEVAGIKGQVLEIAADYLTMQVDGVIWRLELGQNLRQLEKIGEEKTPTEPQTTASVE